MGWWPMIDRQRRVRQPIIIDLPVPMRASGRARGYDRDMTRLHSAVRRLFGDAQTDQEIDTSADPERVDGVVDEVRESTDPRLPELTTDDEIEMLADGADLVRLRCETVEHRTALDRLLGSSSETDVIREVLVDLDGLDVGVGDEIVVEAIPIETDDDPTVADLWLSTDESALARIPRDAREVVSRLALRDDALDDRMDLVPHLDRRQRVEIWIQRANYRLARLFGRVAR